ncbi:DUF6583 family protein [Paraliobacillus sediminis]|uniref:DUF6583 family protein n=1 Tax=Paraliobacillus sediminis TaxID=1885916 RepID=UPI000E3BFD75|nr:DUF6583 family protein [Paraliobacillus sediminis]
MERKSKRFSKKTIWISIIAAVILVGGTITATTLLTKTSKQDYFLAELNTANFMTEVVENRYSAEFDWAEEIKETPSETNLELSAAFNDPAGFDSTGMQEIINSSTISLTNSLDPENKEMKFEAAVNVAEMSIEDIEFYLTTDKMLASVPFLDQYVQVKENELGNLLYEIDPMTYTGEEEIEFDSFFNQTVVSEDEKDHFQDAYLKMVYEELPEDSFTSEDESIEVNGESITTSKITLQLSEEKMKEIMVKVLNEAEQDEILKEVIQNQASFGSFSSNSDELAQITEDFEAEIAEAKEAINDFKIPGGLTSTLWIKDDLIVQRDFSVEMGPSESELVVFEFIGKQVMNEQDQMFDYELVVTDEFGANTMNLTGDLSWQDNVADDQITVSVGAFEASYTGSEEIEDGTRNFDRRLAIKDEFSSPMEVIWNGTSTYNNDQTNTEQYVSLKGDGISENDFKLHINTNSQLVKSLDIDTESMDVVNLGTMSTAEIDTFMMEDVTPQFEQWMTEFYGSMFDSGSGL